MTMSIDPIRFDGQVAIVTGAGRGLGRAHAIGLAARGAKVLVNDVGHADQSDSQISSAENVVDEIRRAGGEAFADGADVTNFDQVQNMVQGAVDQWGRVDILVNNAGILRDKTFIKMELADFRLVFEVHVMGSVHCTKAVLPLMREKGYGRIVFTSSASGIYGNFGQSNYGAAKAAMIGLMNVLDLESAKYGIKVNILAPSAATAMTAGLLDPGAEEVLKPEWVTQGLLFLVSRDAPSSVILAAGAGVYARTHIVETRGIFLPEAARTPEMIAEHFNELSNSGNLETPRTAWAQCKKFSDRALAEDS
jgi:NAD(P)-dependent dehydrogenase (short-subunit alcohol dehydrogenase family)